MDRISALMDGELDAHAAHQEYARLRQDGALRETWDTFHLIGDVLRGDAMLSDGFAARFAARLAQEPTVLAPRRLPARRPVVYAFSAAASLSAIGLVAWVALSVGNPAVPPSQTAQAPAAAAAAPQIASVPNEGQMNEYLLAHQGVSPSTAIQGLAPYIRSVSVSPSPAAR
jgi:sigma-E factor negative regulatory protein RseA